MSNMRTIRVTGKGQIKVKPDTTRLTISLEGTYPEYSEALRHSSLDTEQLKDIQSIDYSWGEIDFEYRPMNRMLMADECIGMSTAEQKASYDMDIEPDDIEVSDTVTVLWEIG